MKQPSQIREEELGLVEDGDAIFASILWYEDQLAAGKLKDYQGKHIAILGEQIIDSDPDEEALSRRIEVLGDSIKQIRVVLRYIARPEDVVIYR